MRLQLDIEYDLREIKEKAFEHYKYLVDTPNTLQDFEIARCYCSLGKISYDIYHDKDVALKYFREGRIAAPNMVDNYIAEAELRYNTKEYLQALELARASIKYCEGAKWGNIYDGQSYYPYWLIGMSYYFLNEKIKALSFMTIAKYKNPLKEIDDLFNNIITDILND